MRVVGFLHVIVIIRANTSTRCLNELNPDSLLVFVLVIPILRATFKDWTTHDIRQVLIETHWLPNPETLSSFFAAFRNNNFAMFSKEPNLITSGNCMEYGFVKLHPDFWHDPPASS
jgi:Methyltransferase domain